MKKPLFFYHLNTQFKNTGDLLINQVYIRLLSAKGDVYVEDHGKPDDFVDALLTAHVYRLSAFAPTYHTVSQFLLSPEAKQVREENECYFVYVPGDMFRSGLKSTAAHVLALRIPFLLRLRGIKILRIGVSMGKLDPLNALTESLASMLYHAYAVRDSTSHALAKRYKFSNLHSIPDLAWAYKGSPLLAGDDVQERMVVLSFRSNTYGTIHQSAYLSELIGSLRSILEMSDLRAHKIVIAYQVAYDRQAACELAATLSVSFDVKLIDEQLGLEKAYHLYQRATCVISNRLHVLLLAIRANTLAIPYIDPEDNQKIVSIYEDNGLMDTVLLRKEEDLHNVRILNQVISQQERWRQTYQHLSTQNENEIVKCLDTILS